MEGQLENLRSLKLELEDQSLLVFEENEDRLKTIQEQETVSCIVVLYFKQNKGILAQKMSLDNFIRFWMCLCPMSRRKSYSPRKI